MSKKNILSFLFYLLLCSSAIAQKNVGVSDALQRYHDTHYEEFIFLHTNSSFLLAGETLLFKAYCLNAVNNTPSELSTIAYVELIDANATAVLQAKILLSGGMGAGDLFLSSTLTSGNYTLIAYTNWMRNNSSKTFFKTEVTIINPFKKAASVPSKKNGLQIDFYPEGGKLLTGVSNTVVFSAVDSKSKGANFTGKILDNAATTVLEFSPTLKGKGRFTFIPEAGKEYKAIIIDTLQNVSFQPLPRSNDEGIVLHVQENQNSFILNLTSRSIGKSVKAKVLVHRRSVPLFEKEIQFINEQAQFEVNKTLLPAGISQITVLSEGNEVVNQRVIFNPPSTLDDIDFQLEKSNYKTRDKVQLTVTSKDALPANLSVNVRKVESKVNDPYSISDYLLLHGGNVEVKSLKGNMAVDDQVLQQKDSYYPINISGDESSSVYLPEVRGNIITGTVTKADASQAAKEMVYLSVPSSEYLFLVARTDSSGRFFFNTDKITFNTELILQVNPATCADCKIRMDVTSLKDYSDFSPSILEIDSSFRKIIERRSILAQIENAYYTEKQDSIIGKSSERFYGQPDKAYKLDDFVRFPAMEDVFIEYVVEILLKKKGEQYEIRAMNFKERFSFNERPLILIDGIPIFDDDQVMNYNPLLLERIEVVGKRYFYGPLESQGIISMTTYAGDGKNISLPQREKYIGILPAKRYYSPDYSKKSGNMSKIPDYRTQLYWNPNVTVSGKSVPLEFYTSDIKGDFEIIADGIKANGQPVHYRNVIHVE